MLRKFSVKNFKNFKDKLVLDFTKVRDYEFNSNLIKNNLVNKMLIYGLNNSGKSNLGAAIMDITTHLTDTHGKNNTMYNYYINGNSSEKKVCFSYEFLLNNKEIKYSYNKDENANLLYEELLENNKLIYSYNYKTNEFVNTLEETKNLDLTKRNSDNMSVLKYIYNNTIYLSNDNSIKLLMEFVRNMLWFRSLNSNEFMGLMSNIEDLNDFIIKNNLLNDFEKFLKSCGQNFKLCIINNGFKQVIGVKYKNYDAYFVDVASTGTKSLWLFYYWMNRTKNVSFVFLDEFDAFYHYSLSKYILKYINNKNSFQSVLTTHNTYLITNELMRPDCYVLLKNGKATSFADSTTKTIRQAHNLEKLMLGGEFE